MSARLFEMMKLQIFSMALQPGATERIAPAYVYAWRSGVYPFFHEADWHKPFAHQFEVTEEMMDALSTHLDACDQAGEIPTFYSLETHYRVRSQHSEWDRSKLLCACRYMRLDSRFGDAFWNSVLRDNDHPAEAKSIMRPYVPQQELYVA